MSAVESPMRKDDRMAELLEVAQFAHQHRVAEVEIGRCGIEAGLDAERHTGLARGFETRAEVVDRDNFSGALGKESEPGLRQERKFA